MKNSIQECPLEQKLKSLIQLNGPISVSTFMSICLHDPEYGYYANKPKIGGDFSTAPEISQIFGEMIGIWLLNEWRSMNCPNPFFLVELGPGRGTLMSDVLRVSKKYVDYIKAVQLVLVETSPVLQKIQLATLAEYSPLIVQCLNDVPSGSMLCIGNEFLDCLPARQFVTSGGHCCERLVGLDDFGALSFGTSTKQLDTSGKTFDGIFEVQEGLSTFVDVLADRKDTFKTLLIDYGTASQVPQDTLRAYAGGAQVDTFTALGRNDLTVDVDFGRLARLGNESGIKVSGPISQRQFLLSLGIEFRLKNLVDDNPDRSKILEDGVTKLIDPKEMGERFKVVCLSSHDQDTPFGF